MRYSRKKENVMKQQSDMNTVIRSIRDNVGSHVKVTKNLGRNKFEYVYGTITETYPCLFTIRLDEAQSTITTASYSYTDVFTNDIRVQFG